MSEMPRRHQMQQWTDAEQAIFDATQEVQSMGADLRLTEAVILLGRARDMVADFVDGVTFGQGYPRIEEKGWKRLAMECMRYLTAEQISEATQASGGAAFICNPNATQEGR